MNITPHQPTLPIPTGLPPLTFNGPQVLRAGVDESFPALHAAPADVSSSAEPSASAEGAQPNEMKEAFSDFVGQTFFGEMIKAFRTAQEPSKYFHGGRAEEIFQGQFDQVLAEKLSDASAEKIADPMFELFMLKRSS